MTEDIAQHLQNHGVRPTAVRILVWRTLAKFDFAFALSDLEGALPTVDRSTLFRSLTLFSDKQLLHILDDGSGQHKYCICQEHEHCDCDHGDDPHHHHIECQHVHFTCTKCGHTFCLKQQHIPHVSVPDGFEVQSISYVIQGLCAHCRKK
ncbi:MAG: transcriptional repressor [Bacteroidales bacterium]|nr:transcriptional repressor [Candidatus Liminaster caballi]